MKRNDVLIIIRNPEVELKFKNYPNEVRMKLERLRSLVMEVANEIDSISQIEETLKWGEPSYLVKNGSTIRMDWKSKTPDQYAMFFKCTSKLVPAFRAVFGPTFNYEKNRALIFRLDEQIPVTQLKHCIKAGLCYHLVKHLPQLGIVHHG